MTKQKVVAINRRDSLQPPPNAKREAAAPGGGARAHKKS